MNDVEDALENAINWVDSDELHSGIVIGDSEHLHLTWLIQEAYNATIELRALYEVEAAALATCRLAMNDGQAAPKALSNALAKLDELRGK